MIWIAVSLILQCSLYLYLDQWYFSSEGNIKVANISSVDKGIDIRPNVTFSGKAKNISVSYDCSYTAYIENGQVKVIDTSSGKERKISFSEGVACLSFKWLPDSNIMMIAERTSYNGRKVIRFYSYDAEKQEKKDTDCYEGGHKVNYMLSNSERDLVNFQISSLTGVLYGKITYSKGNSRIYRIDRNEKLTLVSTITNNIGNVAVASDDDQLIYEDLTSNRIRTNYKTKIISIKNNYKLSLLGTDNDDNFFIGFGEGNISKIYYGKLSMNTSGWKEVKLDKNINTSDLFITQDSNIYYVNKDKRTIESLSKNKTYQYTGKFIQINSNFIAYEENNKLKLITIK